MKLMKRVLTVLITISILISMFSANVFADNNKIEFKAYNPIWFENANLTSYDLKDKGDILQTLSFDAYTKWPSKDKMPADFDPQKILEWGKQPTLGIENLHKQGFTGKGANIAYIDQPLQMDHSEYMDTNIKYFNTAPDNKDMTHPTMHGPSVISILAGKQYGVAPEANIYYFAEPAWINDGMPRVTAFKKLMEVNETLPEDQKIKIVGLSDGAGDGTRKNSDVYHDTVKDVEASGVMVFDVSTINIAPAHIDYFKDRNDPKNFEVAHWYKSLVNNSKPTLFIPVSGVTIANGQTIDDYIYWIDGGMSWAVPYLTGTIALGLQIDPTLTKENAIKYLYDSASKMDGISNGGVINPKGFIELVKKNAKNLTFENTPGDMDYYYFLYNSKAVTSDDLTAIKSYVARFGKNSVLKDVSSYSTAPQIYDAIKNEVKNKDGNFKGIQIFGTAEDVPSFDIYFKIQMLNSVDDAQTTFKSDFFYSTFKNDSSIFTKDFSIYKAFDEKMNVSFIPEWKVSRLPVVKGEYASFIKKYDDYVIQAAKQETIPVVNFSNPIGASKVHEDDMGYFLNRMNSEFNIFNSSEYRLYGNKQGAYPVQTSVLGDFTKENIKKENATGIVDYIINSHGQVNNIDQAVFDKEGDTKDRRISFMNTKDINQVLDKNYYTLNMWDCLNAWGLGTESLMYEALAHGKAVNATAFTTIISNNGAHNNVSYEKLKQNNFYYFELNFWRNISLNKSRSESFMLAQKAYATEILKNTNMLGDGNYQFNLLNVLANHFLGLMEYDYVKKGLREVGGNTSKSLGLVLNQEFKPVTVSDKYTVKDVWYQEASGKIDIYISYEAKVKFNSLVVFNPPNNDIIFSTFNSPKVKDTVKITITKSAFDKLDMININFYTGASNMVSVNKDDVKKK